MKIGILGAGAYGTSIAKNLGGFSEATHEILMYCYEEEVVESINKQHENTKYLKGVELDPCVVATPKLEDLYSCELILVTTPVKFIASLLQQFKDFPKHIPLIIASKGIENETGKLVSDIIKDNLGPDVKIGVLTGPTFATELAHHKISALVLAMDEGNEAKSYIEQLKFSNVKVYHSDDVIGTQIGGAVKNVLAIATGIIEGKKLGHNALAALIARGMVEVARVVEAYGGKKETTYGLSGLGDLVLTATSPESRNFSLGLAIAAAGHYSADVKGEKAGFSEGYFTAKSLYELKEKKGLYLPICTEVYNILYQGKSIDESIATLLNSGTKAE